MTDTETIGLRVTQIGGRRCVNDFTVIWRGMPIGRIMKGSGGRWWWGACNVYDRVSFANDSGNGTDLDDCKAKFEIAWPGFAPGLTDQDIAGAREYAEASKEALARYDRKHRT
jgi:hypothetical protein